MTDTGLAELTGLSKLESLLLNEAPITDDGLESLKKLKNLKMLNLSFCDALSQGAIDDLQEALPDCQISY